MSSLEIVAAPWRAKALSASVLPAPMPPVIATATGRDGDPPSGRKRPPWRLPLFGFGGRRGRLALGVAGAGLVRGLGVCLDALVHELVRQVACVGRGGLRLAARRFDGLRLGFGRGRLRRRSFFSRQVLVCRAFAKGRLRLGEDLLGKIEIGCSFNRLRIVGAETTPPPSTRLSESERRRRSPSTSMILAFTSSPCETTSRGFSTWCWASSEMCTSPSTPGRISTKAPKVTTLVTLPSTS